MWHYLNNSKVKCLKFWILICFCLTSLNLSAQDKPRNWALSGYVKNLQAFYNVTIPGISPILETQNFVHNRLNFKWYLNDHLTFKTGIRTRAFYGAQPVLLGAFDENAGNDVLDLSFKILDEKEFLVHTLVDRLYFEYSKKNWEIRLGRQRVNWGINNFWNPHDIFNAFNFTDFDYEERPGSDALRVKYYTGAASSIEFAAKAFKEGTWDEIVFGFLWKFNKKNTDFQVMTAYFQEDLVLGLGWAGNIGNAILKGEMSTFIPTTSDGEYAFAGTLSYDYSFKNGLFVSAGLLYNSSADADSQFGNLLNFEISPKNLYPYPWSIYVQTGYALTPLLMGNIALIYSPSESHNTFLSPGLTYSVAQDWDFDLISQINFLNYESFATGEKTYASILQAVFMRVKYSF